VHGDKAAANCGSLLSPKIEPKMNSPNLQLPTKSC
jgi:hypothetical protein